jgi:hypothetical protein
VRSDPIHRHYFPPTRADFQPLKEKLEREWLDELCQLLELEKSQLPVIWDADFLYGPKDAHYYRHFVATCEVVKAPCEDRQHNRGKTPRDVDAASHAPKFRPTATVVEYDVRGIASTFRVRAQVGCRARMPWPPYIPLAAPSRKVSTCPLSANAPPRDARCGIKLLIRQHLADFLHCNAMLRSQ